MYKTILIVMLAFLVACTSSDESQPYSFQVHEENGVTIAETKGGSKYEEDLFEYEKVVELRFDSDDEESILNRPRSFIINSDNHLYVADSGNHRIAVFDINGQYVRSFGQEGQGPGDISGPTGVSIFGDLLIITHNPRGRTSIFNKDGTFVEMLNYALGSRYLRRLDKSKNGILVAQSSIPVRGPQDEKYYASASMISSEGDTLAEIRSPQVTIAKMVNIELRVYNSSTETYSSRVEPSRSMLHYNGGPQATYLPESNEILVSTGQDPILKWYDLNGALQREVRIDFPDQIVTKQEKEALVADYDQAIEDAMAIEEEGYRQNSVERAKTLRETLVFPETKAYWNWVIVDDLGFIWLRKPWAYSPRPGNRARSWRVLSPYGEYIGDTTHPESFLVTNISHGYLCIIRLDLETEERIPTAYRIKTRIEGIKYP